MESQPILNFKQRDVET